MSAAALKVQALPELQRVRHPDETANVRGVGREIAANKLEEFARMLRSGELDGCSFEWRDDHGADTRLVTVTVTHRTETSGGDVHLRITNIEEV